MIYKLVPILKYRLWGGSALPKIFHMKTNNKIGEAWILSCLNDDINKISKHKTLLDLFKADPNIIAKDYKGNFPLLIKLIDAQDNLSIQVHPKIKTEFWHVLNAKPSKMIIGLKQKSSKLKIKRLLESGEIISALNNICVSYDDSFLIEPGTIHAIGKKTFLIEIQQSADITYRLYDYNRLDKNNKPRQLHINQALKCINYNQYKVKQNKNQKHLVNCPFFNVYKLKINKSKLLFASDKSFHALTILRGHGFIEYGSRKLAYKPYDTFFVAANTGKYKVTGNGLLIQVTL